MAYRVEPKANRILSQYLFNGTKEVILTHVGRVCVCICLLWLIVGCGSGTLSDAELKKRAGGTLKDVAPVSGTVTVDGSPVAGVYLYAYTLVDGKLNTKTNQRYLPPPDLKTVSDATGKYCWETYRNCDGLPVGEHKIICRYIPAYSDTKTDYEQEDVLNGRYSEPTKTEFVVKVEKGKPQTGVDYALTTK